MYSYLEAEKSCVCLYLWKLLSPMCFSLLQFTYCPSLPRCLYVQLKSQWKLTALSAFLTFWHTIGIHEYVRGNGEVGAPCRSNIVECQGIYIAYVYGVRRIPLSKQARCLFQACVRRSDRPVVEWRTLAFVHVHAQMRVWRAKRSNTLRTPRRHAIVPDMRLESQYSPDPSDRVWYRSDRI